MACSAIVCDAYRRSVDAGIRKKREAGAMNVLNGLAAYAYEGGGIVILKKI